MPRISCADFRPDHNGECLNCDEWLDSHLPDGLYRVETPQLCAGFVVRNGRAIDVAPILRRRLVYWANRAVWIAP